MKRIVLIAALAAMISPLFAEEKQKSKNTDEYSEPEKIELDNATMRELSQNILQLADIVSKRNEWHSEDENILTALEENSGEASDPLSSLVSQTTALAVETEKKAEQEKDDFIVTLERAYEMQDTLDAIIKALEDIYKKFQREKARLKTLSFDGVSNFTINVGSLKVPVCEAKKPWEHIHDLDMPFGNRSNE